MHHHFIGNYPDVLAHRARIRAALINSGNHSYVQERKALDSRGNAIEGMYALWGTDEFKRKRFHKASEGQVVAQLFASITK